jgi:hypothetical protein
MHDLDEGGEGTDTEGLSFFPPNSGNDIRDLKLSLHGRHDS